MIKIENSEVLGWEHAIRGMRNPLNSWSMSDSGYGCPNIYGSKCSSCNDMGEECCNYNHNYCIGENDLDLMKRLVNAGTDHRKFMRMIVVYADIVAPMYWWKEFDTYKVGTVRNSCSTMHKIQAKEFDRGDFSHDNIPKGSDAYSDTWDFITSKMFFCINEEEGYYLSSENILDLNIKALNHYRKQFIETKDKKYWWQMIQLLPSSYNQRATVMLNYEVLSNMYHSRKNHKLDEWKTFCRWVETLPHSELITGEPLNEVTDSKE